MTPLIETALQAHRAGQIPQALAAYERCLEDAPANQLALYGCATIRLSGGDMAGYPLAVRALLANSAAEGFDRAQAAASLVQLLLQQQYQDHAKALLDLCAEKNIAVSYASELRAAVSLPDYLTPTHYDVLQGRELERYRPMESTRYVYAIDVVGGCNLRCPTCPVAQQTLPKGTMSVELYRQILGKIKAESIDHNPDIWLFNWSEPLLHPQLDQIIAATHEMGLTSFISSNLNVAHRLESVIKANPTRMKISLSSLRQEAYGQTHARGNIDQVVENMRALAKWRDQHRSTTQIWIGHHLYRHTLQDQTSVAALAQELGFGYAPSPAIVAPIEKVVTMMDDPQADDFQGLRQQFLTDPLELRQAMANRRSGSKDCELRFNMTAIQFDGTVNLCCGTTQKLTTEPVAFMDYTHAQLEDMKYNSAFCKKCMDANLHLTSSDR